MCSFFEIVLPNRGKNSHRIIGQIDSNGCWLCTTLAKDHGKYVKIFFNGTNTRLHRVVYKVFIGSVPDDKVIRHKCDNPGCCNPDHLELGTALDNARDMVLRGRVNKIHKLLSDNEKKAIAGSQKTIEELAKEYQVSYNTIVYARRKFRKSIKERMAPDKPSIPHPDTNNKSIKKASSKN